MSTISPRKPAIAALLSFAMPGLGQFYNGRKRLAAAIFALLLLASCLPAAVTAVAPEMRLPLFQTALLATLLIYLAAIGQAFMNARQLNEYRLTGSNHGYLYAGIWIVATALLLTLTFIERSFIVHAFKIPSSSMAPTVQRGDYLLATKRAGQIHPVKHGDIIIFTAPDNPTLYYIKRAVGLPGDQVNSDGKRLFINGVDSGIYKGEAFDMQVPHGHIFAIGDNREHTSSSRDFGTVPIRDVIGKPILKWRAADGETGPM